MWFFFIALTCTSSTLPSSSTSSAKSCSTSARTSGELARSNITSNEHKCSPIKCLNLIFQIFSYCCHNFCESIDAHAQPLLKAYWLFWLKVKYKQYWKAIENITCSFIFSQYTLNLINSIVCLLNWKPLCFGHYRQILCRRKKKLWKTGESVQWNNT